MFYLILFLVLRNAVQAKDSFTFDFVKGYIENEHKPTVLYCNYLCWPKEVQINMYKILSKAAIRVKSGFDDASECDKHHILFLVDLECDMMVLTNTPELFSSPYRWLILTKPDDSSAHRYLWKLPIPLNSDFVVAEKSTDKFSLFELHKPSLDGVTRSAPRGHFNGSLFDIRTDRELFRRRKNVMGHPLTMSNVIQDSNTTQFHLPREDRLMLQYDAAAKLNWIVFRNVAEMINATPRYVFSHRYGFKINGEWSGMIQDLESKRADLGTNCIPIQDRLSVAVFTDCLVPIRLRFILRQPPLSYVANIFTLPFAMNVWFAVFLFILVSSVAVYLANKWEASSRSIDTSNNVADAVFFTISSLSQQSTANEPKTFSGRITSWFIFIAMMSLFTAYSANIVVLLQAPSTAIKTLEQLRNSKITLSALDVDYNHFILETRSKEPIRKDIYKKIFPDTGKPRLCSFEDCLEKLREGLFAFHVTVEPVYRRIEETFLETEKCDLIEIDFVNSVDTFVPVVKDSPYLELLRVAFKRVRESGILAALQKRLMATKPRCTNKTAFASVGLVNLRPVVILMMYGIAASIITWIGEVIVHKMSDRVYRLWMAKHKAKKSLAMSIE